MNWLGTAMVLTNRLRMMTNPLASKASRWAMLTAICLVGIVATTQSAAAMGDNGGIRLLLHVQEAHGYPGGRVLEDPCVSKPDVGSVHNMEIEYDGDADTLMVWAFLYHPREFSVMAAGFGIEYEGVEVITTGTCAPSIWQDPARMGRWADSGSASAFGWGIDPHPEGFLEPFVWFLLRRTERDGYFRTTKGRGPMPGEVTDTGKVPRIDPFWEFGSIGFGNTTGELPIPDVRETPGSWGAIEVEVR